MKMMDEALAEKGIDPAIKAPEKVPAQEVQPEVKEPTEVEEPKTEETPEDILNKVLGHKEETANDTETVSPESPDQPSTEDVETKFNVNDIEKIEDPIAKKYAMEAYKSLEKGYQQKFQTLAQKDKDVEALKEEMNTWTPEKVKQLLSNQAFVDASSRIIESENPTKGQMSDDEWSNLNDSEKTQIKSLQDKVNKMERDSVNDKNRAELDKQNTLLTQKYNNYDSSKIMSIRQDMMSGKLGATNEHLYKAFYHDENVTRAYEQGKKDSLKGNKERSDAASYSPDSPSAIPAGKPLEKLKGESSKDRLIRIMVDKVKQKVNLK